MRLGSLSSLIVVGIGTALLTGCGGSSSSSTGPTGGSGGSGAVIQGQILRGRSASTGQSVITVVLQTALGVRVAEAQGGPGDPVDTPIEVTLVQNNTVVATTQTQPGGFFEFRNVLPGTYDIVVEGTTVETVTVGEGDLATISGTLNPDGTLSGDVVVQARDISDIVQNDAQLGHAINIAEASSDPGCDLDGVITLREGRRGWGAIAHRCGVHPSVIGLGRSNLSDADLATARERMGRGKGRGHDKDKGGKGPRGKGPKKKA